MKKVLSVLIALVLILASVSGCAQGNNETSSQDSSSSTSQNESSDGNTTEPMGDPEKIIVTFLTTGNTPEDLPKVQDAVNEITIEKINVEVEFMPVNIGETFGGLYSRLITSGEVMDAMVVPFQDLSNYVNSGLIEPLDELLSSNGSTILELNEEFDMTAGAVIGGQSYGFSPVQQTYGFRGGFVMRKDYFEETGVETKEQYTYDDMTAIFAGIKENHSECYPYGVLGSGVNSSMTTSGFLTEFDVLGSSIQSGVLTSPDSTTIVNLFETDQYKEFLRYSREWYEAGYIMPDAATSDAIAQELLISGKTACYAMNMQPHQTTNIVAQFGWEAVGLNMTEGYLNSTSPSTNIMWTVPVTAENPEAAIKYLNLVYSDYNLSNLLTHGIEDVHYVHEGEIITYPEGVDPMSSSYYVPLRYHGDQRFEYFRDPALSKEINDKWTENNRKRTYQSVGYSYDSSGKSNEMIAIATVLDQYMPALETGSVANWEETLSEMNDKLQAAGIDDVIADNQAQFDAWLANQ